MKTNSIFFRNELQAGKSELGGGRFDTMLYNYPATPNPFWSEQ